MTSLLETAAPLVGTALNVAVQGLLVRAGASLLGSIFASFAVGLGVVVAIEIPGLSGTGRSSLDTWAILAGALLIYGSLGFLFFNFVNAGESSIRVRVLRDLVRCPDGIPLDTLLREYDASAVFTLRMDRLISKGQVVARGQRYFIRRSLLAYAARFLKALKVLLLRRESEFD